MRESPGQTAEFVTGQYPPVTASARCRGHVVGTRPGPAAVDETGAPAYRLPRVLSEVHRVIDHSVVARGTECMYSHDIRTVPPCVLAAEVRPTMPTPTKDARRNLRLRAADDELIRRAAEQAGQSVSEFLTMSAIERAHDVLAGQRDFVLDERTWDEFTLLLDDPVRPDPRLVELFARPQRITR